MTWAPGDKHPRTRELPRLPYDHYSRESREGRLAGATSVRHWSLTCSHHSNVMHVGASLPGIPTYKPSDLIRNTKCTVCGPQPSSPECNSSSLPPSRVHDVTSPSLPGPSYALIYGPPFPEDRPSPVPGTRLGAADIPGGKSLCPLGDSFRPAWRVPRGWWWAQTYRQGSFSNLETFTPRKAMPADRGTR